VGIGALLTWCARGAPPRQANKLICGRWRYLKVHKKFDLTDALSAVVSELRVVLGRALTGLFCGRIVPTMTRGVQSV